MPGLPAAPRHAGVDPSGPVGRATADCVDLHLVDETRRTPAIGDYPGSDVRVLPTWVYRPAPIGPVRTAPAPLIVLAHGFDGHPRKFSALATHWAEAGYVVAVPRFPVSNDEFVAEAGGPHFNERVADLTEQAPDVDFVIDALVSLNDDAGSALAGRVDPERIGLFGLSLGSLTMWNTVLGPHGAGSRAVALIQSDGSFPGAIEQLADVTFPVFMAQSDADVIFPPALIEPQFAAIPTAKYMLVLHDAVHAAVGENTPTPADEAYRAATTVFWDRHLGGRPDEPFPDSVVVDGVTSFIGR